MTFDAAVTLAVLALVVALLATGRVRAPSTAMIGAVTVLLVTGVLEPAVAFAGAGNPAVVTIAALLVLARAVNEAGAVRVLVRRILGHGHGDRRILASLVVPVAGLSAVLNNTPIVATLAPTVRQWAAERNRPPSRFLIPLSYAAILGGMITTIGTSTNLVASGIVAAQGGAPFGLFEVTVVGLPAAILGGIVIVLLAPRLLPDRGITPGPGSRGSSRDGAASSDGPFEFHARVQAFGSLEGATIADAGLRNLAGVYLAGIDRMGTIIAPVSPDQALHGGDVLTFVGRVDHVRDVTATKGLESTEAEHAEALDVRRQMYFEAVVGPRATLVGHTLKDVGFRSTWGAAVMGIRRAGERVDAKLGSVELLAGDVLLLLADPRFEERANGSAEFALVIGAGDGTEPSRRKIITTSLAVLLTVGLAAFGIVGILESSLIGVGIVVGTRVISASDARKSLDLDVLLTIAGALGLGAAVQSSGLAANAADVLFAIGEPFGSVGALAALLVATMLLTEIVSNAAAAALMVPVAFTLAASAGVDPRGYAVGVAISASASFLTPVGYQTNTLVQGLGGYRYGDYWRLGLPVALTVMATNLVIIPLVW